MPYDCLTRLPEPDLIDPRGVPLESSRLPMRPESAGAARRRVRETLQLFDADPDAIENAVLLTSELVTNGLLHACGSGSALHLSVIRDAERLIVEVYDPSRAIPAPLGPRDALSESGRGLCIVEEFAAANGIRLTEQNGKIVWFELVAWPRPPEPTLRQ